MPKIVEEAAYDGVMQKTERLGLAPLIDELRNVLSGFQLLVKEAQDSNGGAAVRRLIDERFDKVGGWVKKQTGDVDWTKCHIVNGTRVCVGVEVQVSARSDLIVMDIVHLRRAIEVGMIDVGILVVPSDKLSNFLTDRAPCMSDAKRHVGHAKAEDLPLILMAMEHDGAGPALAKQKKR
jgi:hypothetical protein